MRMLMFHNDTVFSSYTLNISKYDIELYIVYIYVSAIVCIRYRWGCKGHQFLCKGWVRLVQRAEDALQGIRSLCITRRGFCTCFALGLVAFALGVKSMFARV